MSDTLYFDFDAKVAAARLDFPGETAPVTFLDLSAVTEEEANAAVLSWRKTTSAEYQEKCGHDSKPVFGAARNGFAQKDAITGRGLLALPSAPDRLSLTWTFNNRDIDAGRFAVFVFYHELGHLVVPGCGASTHFGECGADVFGLAYGIHKGDLRVSDIAEISHHRACGHLSSGMFGGRDVLHATYPALDALEEICGSRDMARATPQEIKALAESLAFRHATSQEDFDRACQSGNFARCTPQYDPEAFLEGIAGIRRRNDPSSLAFKGADKLLRDYFSKAKLGGTLLFDHQKNLAPHIRKELGL